MVTSTRKRVDRFELCYHNTITMQDCTRLTSKRCGFGVAGDLRNMQGWSKGSKETNASPTPTDHDQRAVYNTS